ncbi:MAG: phosphoribosylformylglycinamidine synthase subunit PurQ [Bacteriovoracaceae bacterium]
MKQVKAMILAGEGINCEEETASAFLRAGAKADIVYWQEWMKEPNLLDQYQILVFPGGFSYGDELHSGQILALDLKYNLGRELKQFMHRSGLVLGICNGFQVLMKLGLFELQAEKKERTMTLFHNSSFTFIDRWVHCKVPRSRCVWTQGLEKMALPIRHGEGRIILKGDEASQAQLYTRLLENELIALVYDEDVNGSYGLIAGLTDLTGQVLGLMPHPEAALEASLYPFSYKQEQTIPLALFKNAVQYAQENL